MLAGFIYSKLHLLVTIACLACAGTFSQARAQSHECSARINPFQSLAIHVVGGPLNWDLLHAISGTPSDVAARGGDFATLALAINEIKAHLESFWQVTVQAGEPIECAPAIVFMLENEKQNLSDVSDQGLRSGQESKINFSNDRATISSSAQVGLLYGTYDFLELLGFRWYAPDQLWEHRPKQISWPKNSFQLALSPSVVLRGASTSRGARVPDEYLLWMARNRLNLIGVFGVNAPLAQALGIHLEGGGHDLISTILFSAKNVSGKTLRETHPEWYGIQDAKSTNEPIKEFADFYTNPCLDEISLAAYFSAELGRMIASGELRFVDIVDIWPADQVRLDFPKTCRNRESYSRPVDVLFRFYSRIMDGLQVYMEGTASKRKLVLSGISYYDTWHVPSRDVLSGLTQRQNIRYQHIAYVNERTYSQSLGAPEPFINKRIRDALTSWSDALSALGIGLGVCEYYNYSIYGSLPKTFADTIGTDTGIYKSLSINLVTYMHPVGGDPGPLRFLEALRSRLLWGQTTSQVASSDYFSLSFGESANEVRSVYSVVDQALSNLAEMFGPVASLTSIVGQEKIWAHPPLDPIVARGQISKFLLGGDHNFPEVRPTYFSPLRSKFIGLSISLNLLDDSLKRMNQLRTVASDDISRRIASDSEWIAFARAQYGALLAAVRGHLSEAEGGVSPKLANFQIDKELAELSNNDKFEHTLSPINQRQIFLTAIEYMRP